MTDLPSPKCLSCGSNYTEVLETRSGKGFYNSKPWELHVLVKCHSCGSIRWEEQRND